MMVDTRKALHASSIKRILKSFLQNFLEHATILVLLKQKCLKFHTK